MAMQSLILARDLEAQARGASPLLLTCRDAVRPYPVALAAYIRATERHERTRELLCVKLYAGSPYGIQFQTIKALEEGLNA